MTAMNRPSRRRHPATPDLADCAAEPEALVVDLARTLHLWPGEIDLASQDGRRRIAAVVARGLRAQRSRARTGHWSYDFARHARLHALAQRLAALERDRSPKISRKSMTVGPTTARPLAQRSRRVPRPIFLASSERARA